jgi:hypothetical protein
VTNDGLDLLPVEDRLLQDIDIEYADYVWDTEDGYCALDNS